MWIFLFSPQFHWGFFFHRFTLVLNNVEGTGFELLVIGI